jgi:hypothetical protein
MSFLVQYRAGSEDPFSDPTVVTSSEAVIGGLSDATGYEIAVRARRTIGEISAESSTTTATTQTFLAFWPGDVNGDGTVTAQDVVVLASPSCFGATTGFSSDGSNVAWALTPVDVSEASAATVRCDTDRTGSVDVFDFLAIAANAGRTTGKRTESEPMPIVDEAHRTRVESFYESFEPAPDRPEQMHLKEALGEILRKAGNELPSEAALGAPYPNPARHRVSADLELPEAGRVSVAVVNAAGQTVHRTATETMPAGAGRLELEVSAVAPGLYFLVIETEDRRFSRPLVIVR